MNDTSGKSSRLLYMFSRLSEGKYLNKEELSQHFGVSPKSIQRDIEALRCFLSDDGANYEILYDSQNQGYHMVGCESSWLNNDEILAVCKILISSRSMVKSEMIPILDKLVKSCVPVENYQAVKSLIANEKHHYLEPHHGKELLPMLWCIGTAVQKHSVLIIDYIRLKDPRPVTRRVRPVGLMFSEYYFYLVAYIEGIDKEKHFDAPDDIFPTIYRLDRIQHVRETEDHFSVPYAQRFEDGEFRKRIQFMYGGKLQKIRFLYTGLDINSVLDRLPTAEILHHDETGYEISAEVFGTGIEMWLKSQGDFIKKL